MKQFLITHVTLRNVDTQLPDTVTDTRMSSCSLLEVTVGGCEYSLTGRVLGQGGFATVYEARTADGEIAAVKVVHDVSTLSPATRERLEQENATLSLAQPHPNIVGFYGACIQGDRHCFVQEAMPGGDLLDLVLARETLPEYLAQSLVAQVLQALCWLHAKRICHGDVKPENILCSLGSQRVKLADFGLASLLPATGSAPPPPPFGSPLYAPPEAFHSFGADVWACGVTTYMLLSGNFPFGCAAEVASLAPTFEDDCWLRASPLAQDFIERLLRRDPSQRLTAEEALRHPWLANVGTTSPQSSCMEPARATARKLERVQTSPTSKRCRPGATDLGLARKRQQLSPLPRLQNTMPLASPPFPFVQCLF